MGIFDWVKESAILALARLADGTEDDEDTDDDDDESAGAGRTRLYTNHAGGYYVCSHMGCSKKVNPFITDHDCCGRCSAGRGCKAESMADYDGPGTFAHRAIAPTDLAIKIGTAEPGVCTVCDEPLEDHPSYGW